MNNILLISEDYIKSNSTLNDNCFGKWLLPTIRESQEINLQNILGSNLFNKIMSLIENNTIRNVENMGYKALLDEQIRPYLLYQVQANLIPYINFKLGNIGSVVSNDEHIQTLSQGNLELLQNNFQNKADFYARRLQQYILDKADSLKELDEDACNKIRQNLDSAATTGLFLGGYRGKKIKK